MGWKVYKIYNFQLYNVSVLFIILFGEQADSTIAHGSAPSSSLPTDTPPVPTIGIFELPVAVGGSSGGGGGNAKGVPQQMRDRDNNHMSSNDQQQCSNIEVDLKRWSARIRTHTSQGPPSPLPSPSPSCNYYDEQHEVSALTLQAFPYKYNTVYQSIAK